jgi:hypothetical protein
MVAPKKHYFNVLKWRYKGIHREKKGEKLGSVGENVLMKAGLVGNLVGSEMPV